jgi:hypothetical protein
MKRFFVHSLLLVTSFVFVMLWSASLLNQYTPPLLGILTSIYLFSNLKNREKRIGLSPGGNKAIVGILSLTICVLLLIRTTGGFDSLLYFLLYFLSFSIGFLLVPETVFVFAILIVIFFIPEILQHTTLANTTKITSFLLLCPLAYFFSKAVRSSENKEQSVTKIIEDVADIIQSEGTILKDQDIDKLQDIVKQTREIEK